jgi:hypothetical protein
MVLVCNLLLASFARGDASVPRQQARASCRRRLEVARTRLLAGGFSPERNGNTAQWLEVDELENGLQLSIRLYSDEDAFETDEASTFFTARVVAGSGDAPSGWTRAVKRDGAIVWQRRAQQKHASIEILTRNRAEADRFFLEARPALDACLDEKFR